MDGYYAGLNYIFPLPIQASTASYWVHVSGGGANYVGVFALSADTAGLQPIVYLAFFANGTTLSFESLAGDVTWTAPMIVQGTWYHVEMAFDWGAMTFSVSMDGAAVGVVHISAGTTLKRIDVFNAGTGTSEFDGIAISG
jgi:hypothetical protein